jgi:hypothetical protein
MAEATEHQSEKSAERKDEKREERKDEKREERKKDREAARKAEMVVIDLGKGSQKDVRQLRKGRGPLMEDLEDAIDQLRDAGAVGGATQPIVVIVERSLLGRNSGMLPILIPPGFPAMLPFGLGRNDDDDDDDKDDDRDD